MPISIACPACQAKLSVNETILGKRVKCPKCQNVFVAEAGGSAPAAPVPATPPPLPPSAVTASPPPPPPPGRSDDRFQDDAPAPRRSRRARDDEDDDDDRGSRWNPAKWNSTSTGLNLIFWSLLLIMIFMTIGGFVQVFAGPPAPFGPGGPGGFGGNPGATGLVAGVAMMTGCVIIVCGIIMFVGLCMCCSAPDKTTRSRALTTVLLLVGSLVVGVIGGVVIVGMAVGGAQAQAGRAQPDLGSLAAAGIVGILLVVVLVAMGLASLIFWTLFHVSIADYFKSPKLRQQSFIFLAVAIGLTILNFGLGVLIGVMSAGRGQGRGMMMAAQLFNILTSLVTYGYYLFLCKMTTDTIRLGPPDHDEYD